MNRKAQVNGKTFGNLTILEDAPCKAGKARRVWAVCLCGKTKSCSLSSILRGHTTSCGCLAVGRKPTHGMTHSREYAAWRNMRDRCLNHNCHAYPEYGGRGIIVCERWRTFETFYLDMGACPEGMSIDRINNDGPYAPENCRWATRSQQQNNKRNATLITWHGSTLTISQWSKVLKIHRDTIRYRINSGWPIEKVLQP